MSEELARVIKDFNYGSKESANARKRRGYLNAEESEVFYDEILDRWICRFEMPGEVFIPKALQFVRGNQKQTKSIIDLDPLHIVPVEATNSGSDIMDLDIYLQGLKKPMRIKNGDYIYNDRNVGLVIMSAQGFKAKKNRGEIR